MWMKKSVTLLPGLLLLVGLLAWLSGCGTASGSGNAPGGKPDRVSIQIDEVTGTKQVVTLTVASLVQQLYATMYALPQMPDNQPCPANLGPHYTLTFSQGGKTLVTVIAMLDGCEPVSIKEEARNRQATSSVWAAIDQSISTDTPDPAAPS